MQAQAPKVSCAEHGVVVCAVPWARHGSRFTRAFEDQLAWLAVKTSKSAVAELMPVAWRTVGRVCERASVETGRDLDLLAGLRRIGIQARRQGQGPVAAELKGARFALWKNPENLSFRQRTKLADFDRLNRPLYRAYLLSPFPAESPSHDPRKRQ